MSDAFQVVRDFEKALSAYTGAPYVVTTTSCTMALLLAVAWHLRPGHRPKRESGILLPDQVNTTVEIPKHTYIGVPMSIVHAGGRPRFTNEVWVGYYQLRPLPVWDSARWLTMNLHQRVAWRERPATSAEFGGMVCVSFHHTKTLGISTHGGAILHDNPEADVWLRKARFDGRLEGVTPAEQAQYGGDGFNVVGWHCYMTPPTAAEGLQRLAALPKRNDPLPCSDYPDLSQLEIFK